MDTLVLLSPAPVRAADVLARVNYLRDEWMQLWRHCVVHPTAENVAARQAAHLEYETAQREAFAQLGAPLPA